MMIYIAFGFGLWFCLMMVLGAALKWKLPVRIAGVLSVPLIACLAAAVLM